MNQSINGQIASKFGGKPEAQMPGETSRAYDWFLKYLNTNNRRLQTLIEYAVEQRELQKNGAIDGFFPAENTVHSWVKKYKWHERAEAWDARLREEAIQKMNEDRAGNLEQFMKNDLAISLDIQTQVKQYISECKAIDNQNERSHVLFKLTKIYGDARKWGHELVSDHVDKAREQAAAEAEAEEEAGEDVGFDGAPEHETEYDNDEYQQAAG